MDQLKQKLADHAFEAIKFFITLVTFVAGLFVTLFGAYLAFSASGLNVTDSNGAVFWFMNAVSLGALGILWGFHWLVKRTAIRYARLLNELGDTRQNPDVDKALSVLLPVGLVLAWGGTIAIAFVLYVTWSI